MIRSSKHSVKFANADKLRRYHEFIDEYRQVTQTIVNAIWSKGYGDFSVQNDRLELPFFLDSRKFNLQTNLSARALKCLTTQVSGLIRGIVSHRKKKLWAAKKFGYNVKLEKIGQPDCSRINPELNSICADVKLGQSFQWFVQLKSLGKYYGKIRIPIKGTRVSDRWNGQLKNSLCLGKEYLTLRFEKENLDVVSKYSGILGADSGINNILTLSNGEKTPKYDNHGHSFSGIIDKLSRKKKGSLAFKRTVEHRKNFINWSINQLNIRCGELRLEDVFSIKPRSRKLSHWCETLIRDKVMRFCEERKVSVVEQNSTYRSQRCSQCGLVRKSNRKGNVYHCLCGNCMDADLNAAKNHEINLPKLEIAFIRQKRNLEGFYWGVSGADSTVPLTNKKG